MEESKLNVSFFVASIELNDLVINTIKSSNMFRLNITQKPQLIKEEYIVNQIQGLKKINHEFNIVNFPSSMKEITLTIRKVEKKRCLSNALKINLKKEKSKKNNSTDCFTGRQNIKSSSNIQYKYEQFDHSLLGYFTINIENLEKEINHSITVDVITKKESIVIGKANIEICKCDEKEKKNVIRKKNKEYYMNKVILDDKNCYLLD